MKVIGFILSMLILASITTGIWWTGVALFVCFNGPTEWNRSLLMLWGGASIALAYLLMLATARWGV